MRKFDGTILFVSHDRRFIERVADCICCLENGGMSFFDGGYEAFLVARRTENAHTMSEGPPLQKSDGGYRSREERAREAQRRNRTKEIEARLEALEKEEAELNEELVLYASDFRKVREISDRLAALRAESDALYAEYETLI